MTRPIKRTGRDREVEGQRRRGGVAKAHSQRERYEKKGEEEGEREGGEEK